MAIFLLINNLHAEVRTPQPNELPVLRVGVIAFSAPFVMQANNNQFYGFDIATIKFVCTFLQKRCEYVPLNNHNVDSALANNTIDVAIGAIVITPNRANYVAFSMPYLASEGQFIGLKKLTTQDFNWAMLQNKKIGIVKNSAYLSQIESMNISTKILTFDSDNNIISAVEAGVIDVGFINSSMAQYWKHNSNGSIQLIGERFAVGFGLAIAANQTNLALIEEINSALYNYQNSAEYKNNYNLYLKGF
jgi:arginine transport system substrate-binding protein